MNRILLMASSLLLPGLVGCVTRHVGNFSVMATKNVDLSVESEKVATEVVGKNTHWFILIDPTFSFPRVDAAIDDAVNRAGGDFMTDVKVAYKGIFVPVLYYRLSYEVRGDVWKSKAPPSINSSRYGMDSVGQHDTEQLLEPTARQ